MSTEIKDRLNRIIGMCEGNSGVCNDIRFEASMALQAVESQTVAVIAPAIEWGEWEDLHTIVEIRWSKCKGYKLSRIGKSVIVQAFEGDDDFDYPIKQTRTTESEAMDACQAHKQATVNAAIEGCNVRPWVDSQLEFYDLMDVVIEHLEQIANGRRQQEGINATLLMAKANYHNLKQSWEEQNSTKTK